MLRPFSWQLCHLQSPAFVRRQWGTIKHGHHLCLSFRVFIIVSMPILGLFLDDLEIIWVEPALNTENMKHTTHKIERGNNVQTFMARTIFMLEVYLLLGLSGSHMARTITALCKDDTSRPEKTYKSDCEPYYFFPDILSHSTFLECLIVWFKTVFV